MSQSPIMPLFHTSNRTTPAKPIQVNPAPPKPKKPQQTRFDKTHGMKFPVTEEQDRLLRMFWKRYKEAYQATSITVFVTMMLRYGLNHPHLVQAQPYNDTGTYKTAKPNQVEYDLIGGENGVAIKWGVSERKALHRIIISVLRYMETGGRLDHASLQQFKPFK